MFNFLKSKPTPKRKTTRPPKNYDNEKKKMQYDQDKIAQAAFLEQVKNDPSMKRQLIAKTFGLNLPEVDKAKENRDKIEATINEEALSTIMSDPDLKKRLAEKRVNEIVGAAEEDDKDENGYEIGDPVSEMMDRLDQDEELKRRLGVRNGEGLSGLITPEVLTEIIKMIGPALMGMKAQQQQPQIQIGQEPARVTIREKIYVVQVNGENKELSEYDYKQYLAQGAIKPVQIATAVSETPKPEPIKVIEPVAPPVQQLNEAPLPAFLTSPLIDDIGNIMELQPEEVAEYIQSQAIDPTNKSAQIVWEFVKNAEYNVIINSVQNYRTHSKVGSYIQRLMTPEGKIWFEGVVKEVRRRSR